MNGALVCLPFAGGGASFYRAWKRLPGEHPSIVPLQLPGREELFTCGSSARPRTAPPAAGGNAGLPGRAIAHERRGRSPFRAAWRIGST